MQHRVAFPARRLRDIGVGHDLLQGGNKNLRFDQPLPSILHGDSLQFWL